MAWHCLTGTGEVESRVVAGSVDEVTRDKVAEHVENLGLPSSHSRWDR